MKFNKTKLISSLIGGAILFLVSLTSQATYILHSGTNCHAANTSQADLMLWNKDGLTNNAAIDLFVICPVDIDWYDWDRTPSLLVIVSIFMPPNYGPPNATGPFCVARSGIPIFSLAPTDDQIFVQTAFNVATFQGTAVYGDTKSFSLTLNGLDDSIPRSAHLLCLLPKIGGTLQNYYGVTQ